MTRLPVIDVPAPQQLAVRPGQTSACPLGVLFGADRAGHGDSTARMVGLYTVKGMVARRAGGWMHLTLPPVRGPVAPLRPARAPLPCGGRPPAGESAAAAHRRGQAPSPRRHGMGGPRRGASDRWEGQLDHGPCAAPGGDGGHGGGHWPLKSAVAPRRFRRTGGDTWVPPCGHVARTWRDSRHSSCPRDRCRFAYDQVTAVISAGMANSGAKAKPQTV